MSERVKPIALGLSFVLLFTLLGFRVGHPRSGLKSAAGSAVTSLVIYRHQSKFNMGDRVVITFPKKEQSPAVGVVKSVSDREAIVQTDNISLNVPLTSIRGKLYGVLPFIDRKSTRLNSSHT